VLRRARKNLGHCGEFPEVFQGRGGWRRVNARREGEVPPPDVGTAIGNNIVIHSSARKSRRKKGDSGGEKQKGKKNVKTEGGSSRSVTVGDGT